MIRVMLPVVFAATSVPQYAGTGRYCSVAARDEFDPFDAAFVMHHKRSIERMRGSSPWEAPWSYHIV